MRCEKCGAEYEKKPRFCEKCGSYFIDADDPQTGLEWRGVIRSDGSLADTARTYVIKDGKGQYSKPASTIGTSARVWSILAVVFAGIALFFNAIAVPVGSEVVVLGFGPFVFSLIVTIKNAAGKLRLVAGLLLILAAVLFFIALMND